MVAGGGGLLGRVWEGATAPLPIERACERSELVLGGPGGILIPLLAATQQSYPQAFSRARGLGKD